jgi:hypothetical protein
MGILSAVQTFRVGMLTVGSIASGPLKGMLVKMVEAASKFATEEVAWPSVVSAIAAAVAAIAAAIGTFFAWRSSTASAMAARDANRALAMLMFPNVLHHVYQQVVDADDKTTPVNRWYLDVWNASSWDAVDVEAEVRLLDARTFSGKAPRLHPASNSPPSREDDQLVVEIGDMPADNAAGYRQIVATVIRWSDAQHIARWEARRDWSAGYAPPFADSVRQIRGPSITTT